ncbi:hypothetical protein BC827DRAFT_1152927 [Russula dissimulans]|nr:hypothetical protein BC827DRAFT_1152927 [Russula dissimulans]
MYGPSTQIFVIRSSATAVYDDATTRVVVTARRKTEAGRKQEVGTGIATVAMITGGRREMTSARRGGVASGRGDASVVEHEGKRAGEAVETEGEGEKEAETCVGWLVPEPAAQEAGRDRRSGRGRNAVSRRTRSRGGGWRRDRSGWREWSGWQRGMWCRETRRNRWGRRRMGSAIGRWRRWWRDGRRGDAGAGRVGEAGEAGAGMGSAERSGGSK